uniref:PPARG related coactivator 1 n=1 Tax=Salarias fasciatus TaxID=181472 RepID=A0A672G5A2_SALFA
MHFSLLLYFCFILLSDFFFPYIMKSQIQLKFGEPTEIAVFLIFAKFPRLTDGSSDTVNIPVSSAGPCADTLMFLLPSAKEEQCVPEVSGRAAAVGNSRLVTLQPPKAALSLTPPATPPHQMWKPLAPMALLGKNKITEVSKSAPSKVIQIEARPLPSIKSRSKPTPAAAPVDASVACMDHDYCLSSKGGMAGEPGKRWNVKQQSFITIKPITPHAVATAQPVSAAPASPPPAATNPPQPAKTTPTDCPPLPSSALHIGPTAVKVRMDIIWIYIFVYVGRIRGTMTQKELKERFSYFGEIEECTLHFRDQGDNYGFVTYYDKKAAFTAIENGGKLRKPDELPFDLCFGGRRQFCQSSYADLDSNREYDPLPGKGKYHALDFDTLLKQAQQNLKR